MSLYEKMIDEAVGATKAVFGVNKANRGGTFKVTDAKPYVDAVNKMTVVRGAVQGGHRPARASR